MRRSADASPPLDTHGARARPARVAKRDRPIAVATAALMGAAVVGAGIGSVRDLPILAVALLYCAAWFAAVLAGRTLSYAFALSIAVLILLPDVLGNAGYSQLSIGLIGVNAIILLGGVRGPIQREDIALLVVICAVGWPYLVGGGFATAPGALGATVAVYVIGRGGGVPPSALVGGLAAVGAIHAIVAVTQSVPALAGVVPFTPLREGAVFFSGRAVGLFNNPNTLGTFETVALLAATCVAPRRSIVPLLVLCAAGLILSSSREALLGLVIGAASLLVVRFRDVAWPMAAITVAGVAAATVFPAVVQRLDPSGYSSDPNLLGRVDAWRVALSVIARSPGIGYGASLPQGIQFVDNTYLVWLLMGGVAGLVARLLSVVLITPRELWPVLTAMLVIAMLANPFAGPTFSAFLVLCGTIAAAHARNVRAIAASNSSLGPTQPGL